MKGLHQVLAPVASSEYEFSDSRVYDIRLDFSGIAYYHCYFLVKGERLVRTAAAADAAEGVQSAAASAEEAEEEMTIDDNNKCVTCGGYYICLDLLAEKICNAVCALKVPRYKLTVCLDGEKRPLMKKRENERRAKYADHKSKFIKRVVKTYAEEVLELARAKGRLGEFEVLKNDFEADASVTEDADVALTTDGDVFLLGLSVPRLEVTAFFKPKGMTFVNMEEARLMGVSKFLYFSCIAGNDYLPSIYAPQDYPSMFAKMSNCSIEQSYRSICTRLRPKKKLYKCVDDVRPVVSRWLKCVRAYVKYVKSHDSRFLDDFEEDLESIKQCDPGTVLVCLNADA